MNARVQGDGAVEALVAGAPAGEPDSRTSSSASWAGAAAAGRTSPRSTARRSAAPSPTVRVPTISAVGHETDHLAHRSGRRPPRRRRRPPRRRWRSPTAARCCGSWTISPRGSPAASAAAPGWRRAAGAHRRPAARLDRGGARARAAPGRPARRPARRAEPAPDPRSRLRGAGRTPTATSSSAGRISPPVRPFDCGWPTATSPPGWSRHEPSPQDLSRLEEIVRKLEAEDVELDAALALFEEGVARLRAARERLARGGGQGADGAGGGGRRPPARSDLDG